MSKRSVRARRSSVARALPARSRGEPSARRTALPRSRRRERLLRRHRVPLRAAVGIGSSAHVVASEVLETSGRGAQLLQRHLPRATAAKRVDEAVLDPHERPLRGPSGGSAANRYVRARACGASRSSVAWRRGRRPSAFLNVPRSSTMTASSSTFHPQRVAALRRLPERPSSCRVETGWEVRPSARAGRDSAPAPRDSGRRLRTSAELPAGAISATTASRRASRPGGESDG